VGVLEGFAAKRLPAKVSATLLSARKRLWKEEGFAGSGACGRLEMGVRFRDSSVAEADTFAPAKAAPQLLTQVYSAG